RGALGQRPDGGERMDAGGGWRLAQGNGSEGSRVPAFDGRGGFRASCRRCLRRVVSAAGRQLVPLPVADFDGPAAMLDALAYAKAARASAVAAALEISQSGRGAHVWVLFTEAIPAAVARGVGTAVVHEAMVLRGSMDLRSYDRLFPNQDVLPEGGFGNLIAAPLAERDQQQRDEAVIRIQAELARIAEQRARDATCPRADKTRQRNEAAHVRAECALR